MTARRTFTRALIAILVLALASLPGPGRSPADALTLLPSMVKITSPVQNGVITGGKTNVSLSYDTALVPSLLGITRLDVLADGQQVATKTLSPPAKRGTYTFVNVNLSRFADVGSVKLEGRAWVSLPLLGQTSMSPPVTVVLNAQEAGIQRLRTDSTIPPMVDRRADGVPTMVSVNIPLPGAFAGQPLDGALWFLDRYRDLYGVGSSDVFLERAAEDSTGGTLLTFAQLAGGIPVHRGQLTLRVSAGNALTTALANHEPAAPQTVPLTALDAVGARAIALGLVDGDAEVLDDPRLVWFAPMTVGDSGPARPAWEVTTRWQPGAPSDGTREVVVDANTGTLLRRYTTVMENGDREGEDFDIEGVNDSLDDWDSCFAIDNLAAEYEEEGPVGSVTPDGTAAFGALHRTYHYFYDRFGRESWDEDGDDVEVAVNIEAEEMPTAAYQGGTCEMIGIRQGWATDDTLTHEFTHGIDDHEGDLDYLRESGAADESFADLQAAFASHDWIFGEGIPGFPCIRDLSRVLACGAGLPDRYSELVISNPDKAGDWGGVHTNSGILEYAGYLLTDGGTHRDNGIQVVGIGHESASVLYYDVLNGRVGGSMSLRAVRGAIVSRARERGFTPAQMCAVIRAHQAVELGPGDQDCDGLDDVADRDDDGDGIPDANDEDVDNDFIPNTTDNCATTPNGNQRDADGDRIGDACDFDADNDGIPNATDNCPAAANRFQEDFNADARGDHCTDTDGDGISDRAELTAIQPTNPRARDTDSDGLDDLYELSVSHTSATDRDHDDDGLNDGEELFPDLDGLRGSEPHERWVFASDPLRRNTDSDSTSDGFDKCRNRPSSGLDSDNDFAGQECDVCPTTYNPYQEDADGDHAGDLCDTDRDGDGVDNGTDTCPDTEDAHQIDLDGDGQGLACDGSDDALFNGDALRELDFTVEFDAFGRARIPFDPCRLACGKALKAGSRTAFALSTTQTMAFRTVDNFGGGGDSARPSKGASLLFRPAPDVMFQMPNGKPISQRSYYLELELSGLADAVSSAPISMSLQTAIGNAPFPT